jgi:hypothetical protein
MKKATVTSTFLLFCFTLYAQQSFEKGIVKSEDYLLKERYKTALNVARRLRSVDPLLEAVALGLQAEALSGKGNFAVMFNNLEKGVQLVGKKLPQTCSGLNIKNLYSLTVVTNSL